MYLEPSARSVKGGIPALERGECGICLYLIVELGGYCFEMGSSVGLRVLEELGAVGAKVLTRVPEVASNARP